MTPRQPRLHLQAGATITNDVNWRIEQGCLRLSSWSDRGEPFTLGLWGPGDMVIPSLLALSPVQLLALSTAPVEDSEPSGSEREALRT